MIFHSALYNSMLYVKIILLAGRALLLLLPSIYNIYFYHSFMHT